jgi:hypothetical protein
VAYGQHGGQPFVFGTWASDPHGKKFSLAGVVRAENML